MKKRMLSVCLALLLIFAALPLTASAAGEVEINETDFPDPVFRSYVSENFDLNGDLLLDSDEIAAVTSLDLSNTQIADLQGIKFFPLTSLNVNGCTDLYILDCSYISALISLDVSGCTALQTLNCYNTKLTALDVSGCTALQGGLDCSNNQLTSLDVDACIKLRDLDCYNNQLTSLDVSGCTALQALNCYGNQLTSLDVSGCSELRYLECHNNQLTALNVSDCAKLVQLKCNNNQLTGLDVSGCSELRHLECNNNQLTSLNVSGCTLLQYLYCSNNQLTGLDVSGCTAYLQYLYCSNNQLTGLDVSGFRVLRRLECYNNQLTSLNVNQRIEHLVCNNNQLTALDLYRGLALRNLSSQTSSLEIQKISGCWTANLGKLVGAENLNKVELKEGQDWQYDAATGRASYTGEDVLAQLVYCYNGNNLIKEDLDVTVNLIETEEEQQYVVMKQSAEQAYVNGIVAPTTQYASGYAKMDNVSGTMQLPLRYIAEVNGFTVDYDENTGEIKVTSPADETYLLITPNSSTVTKHTADGTLISSSDAPLAFTIENGVTMGPLRFICEALGLKVSYQQGL